MVRFDLFTSFLTLVVWFVGRTVINMVRMVVEELVPSFVKMDMVQNVVGNRIVSSIFVKHHIIEEREIPVEPFNVVVTN